MTLDNGCERSRPNTLGPTSLLEYANTLDTLATRAAAGEIHAVAVTGKPFVLAAGADLSQISEIPDRETARKLAELGHHALGKASELGVPSFVFINGLALGGGLELALHADFRTVDASVRAIGLPEVFLGLVPGWGGTFLLPNLVGIENALKVIVENPLRQNRMLTAGEALKLGIADAMFPAVHFLADSIRWADGVVSGQRTVKRANKPGRLERLVKWDAAIRVAAKTLNDRIGTVPRAPYAALDLLRAAKNRARAEAFDRESEALAELIVDPQGRASIYAFNLVQKRAKRPAGAPDPKVARHVTKVGVLGAGYMASQLALRFVVQLRVPVILTDVDQERVDHGLAYVAGEVEKLRSKERISDEERNLLVALLEGTTDLADFADCDWVIEAVFDELAVKQDVFAELERFISPEAVLATNTSSLSVEQIGVKLAHPERLVGFHFFTPVAVMPLVEVVRAPQTNEPTVSTAILTAKALKKDAVITLDTPGFVVNRVLAVLLGETMRAVDGGATFEAVDQAMAPLGLPMAPSALLDLVGLSVAARVLDAHHAAFPERFYRSDNLHKLADHGKLLTRDRRGKVSGFDPGALRIVAGRFGGRKAGDILTTVQNALANEVRLMLQGRVVHQPEDVDLCMILGAGFPFHLGGLTPYLDRVGASDRMFSDTFHHPQVSPAVNTSDNPLTPEGGGAHRS